MISVGMLTYNRIELFVRARNSLARQTIDHYLSVVDNGSTDGTEKIVYETGGTLNLDGNHTVGHGMNLAIHEARCATDAEIILFTADDYEYKPDALERLQKFWDAAPPDIVIASCVLERAYPWNSVIETGDAGGQHYAVRETVPGSNWSFRKRDAYLILPIRETTGGEDLEICRRLTEQGCKLVELDLCTHIGEKESAWGNRSWEYGRPFNRVLYGFEPDR